MVVEGKAMSKHHLFTLALAAPVLFIACSGSSGSTAGTGGNTGSNGGSAVASGSHGSSAGSTSSTGPSSSGGSVGGGSVAGRSTSEGSVGPGGSSAGTVGGGLASGGAVVTSGGTGGTPKGGSGGTAGASATGGSTAKGGSAAGGTVTGGGATGGTVVTGGTSAPGGATSIVGTLVNTYDGARTGTVSFDLGWKFHLGDASGAQAATFDDSSWTALDVPHDWSISLAFNQSSPAKDGGGYLDGGLGWYRKTFTLPATAAGQKVFLQFDGVYMDSTVYLNGTQVCARPYGYASFECDITTGAKTGASNVVAVKVNNQQPSSRWYSGSGIYRHVWLKTVNPVHVAYTGTQVTTPTASSSSATVNIAVTVQNDGTSDASVTVASSVRDASGTEVGKGSSDAASVAAGKSADAKQTVTVSNPKLWSPSSPNMYSVVTTVSVGGSVVDTYTTPFGIRTFAFDANTGFSINGTKMKLNGTCNHHDLGALGAAVNTRAMEKRLQMLKDMGGNALRTSHNPPAPDLLDLADRLGFLVMDEAFDCWYAGKNTYDYGRFFNDWYDKDVQGYVARDRNHPSVIIWSIGNEVAQAGDKATVQKLIASVHAKDTTRVTAQAYAAWVGVDSITGLEDLVGINYAPDRYDSVHSSNPNYKMFASESSSALRSRGIYNGQNTQCSSYDDQAAGWGATAEASWKNVNTRAWIAGEFIWTGFDYIGEPTPYTWPAKSSYFGMIDTADFPKDVYYFYQSKWNASGPTMVHIVPMNWTNWTAGQAVKVLVYTNADSVELFLNDKSQGSKTMDASTAKLQWSVPFATGTLEARASKGGTVVATDKLQTAGAAAALQMKADRSTITADGRDLSFVEVDVLDDKGVLVPNASNAIDFALDGPGTIAGLDNGNPIDHGSYKGTTRSAFSGKAMAIIRSTATAGKITLKATSGSLTAAS
ncbi:MAG TPA: glycoside hydrolase family 2 TIM barrel-domain containing protein, partial [Mycobacterium sp.]|nr:glycoside hydrolase family 2 TIM barrel-domain containing protein [Mycobacterium sp.]